MSQVGKSVVGLSQSSDNGPDIVVTRCCTNFGKRFAHYLSIEVQKQRENSSW